MCDIVLFKTITNICPFMETINIEMCNERNIITPYVLNILLSSITGANCTKLKLIKLVNIKNKYNINSINWDVTIQQMNQYLKKKKKQMNQLWVGGAIFLLFFLCCKIL